MTSAQSAVELNNLESRINSLLLLWFDAQGAEEGQKYLDQCSELETEWRQRTGRPSPIWKSTIFYMTGDR